LPRVRLIRFFTFLNIEWAENDMQHTTSGYSGINVKSLISDNQKLKMQLGLCFCYFKAKTRVFRQRHQRFLGVGVIVIRFAKAFSFHNRSSPHFAHTYATTFSTIAP